MADNRIVSYTLQDVSCKNADGERRKCGSCGEPATTQYGEGVFVYDSCDNPVCQEEMMSLAALHNHKSVGF